MAAALRSSVGFAIRRAAASSRLSSGGRNASANTVVQLRRMHCDYSGGSSDKGDGYFAAAASIGTLVFVGFMDGELYFGWGKEIASRPPRMSSRRRRY